MTRRAHSTPVRSGRLLVRWFPDGHTITEVVRKSRYVMESWDAKWKAAKAEKGAVQQRKVEEKRKMEEVEERRLAEEQCKSSVSLRSWQI